MTKKYIQDFKSKLSNGGTLAPEELQDFFSRLEGDLKDKKYGLVWESQTEQVIEQLKTNKVYLEEEHDLKITQDPDNPKSNILIEGDNYEALTYLKEINKKVDVIYIDPPYNTGNKDFIYNDRFIDKEDGFRHSSWLSFMNKRLNLARELLTEDGVIFISIDDNEMAQLKILCDQIFGELNKLGSISAVNNLKGRSDDKFFATSHEYLLVYAKNINMCEIYGMPTGEDYDKEFKFEDNISKYKKVGLKKTGKNSLREDRPNMFYSIYYSVNNNVLSLEKNEDSDVEIIPYINGKEGCWRWGRETFLNKKDTELTVDRSKSGEYVVNVKMRNIVDGVKRTVRPKTTWIDPKYDSGSGTRLLKDMFDFNITFTNPKPLEYIKDVLRISTSKDSVILDFFAGSGTTGHAVLELNKEDGGNRQFILCTNNENNIAEEVTYERNKRVMNGYTTPKGKDVPGIPSNLAYYKTKQVSKYDIDFDEVVLQHIIPTIQLTEGVYNHIRHSEHILQLGENIFIFNQYMVEDDEIDTLVGLLKDGDILYIQEGQVDYIKTKLPEGVVYNYLEDILPTNR